MASSLVPQRVKNTGIDLIIGAALIGGAVLLVGYGNKKFNILGKFVSGVTSIGSSVGQAVGAGVSSIPIGIGQGATSVFQTGSSSNNLSRQNLGLAPETSTCAYIPFTNIPIPGSKCDQQMNSLQQTSGTIEANKQATNNGAVGVLTVVDRTTGRSTATISTQPGSNLQIVNPGASSIAAVQQIFQGGTNPNLSQSNNLGIKAAYNSIVSLFNPTQASQATGQTIVGNYIVPGGLVQPLTQNSVDYYQKNDIRIQRV